MRTNRSATTTARTHEGAPAVILAPEKELAKTVACTLLFEDTFYEGGVDIAERIKGLSTKVGIPFLCAQAIRARSDLRIRHAALYLCVLALAKKRTPEESRILADTIAATIQRADELAEILALYWKGGKKPLPRALKRGIALAFQKFNAYALAKYDRKDAVKLRDALFLSHAKPKDEEQAAIWKKLVDGTLEAPDTWEVALSSGADKRATWERLLAEKKLGDMALLRNLRNMVEAGVPQAPIQAALGAIGETKALPFRFIAAASAAPSLAEDISMALLRAVDRSKMLRGLTAVVVDVSGSMGAKLSARSDITRAQAASGLAALVREVAEGARVFAYSDAVAEVAAYRGLALATAIPKAVPNGGTQTGGAVSGIMARWPAVERILVITDEQSHDVMPAIGSRKGYVLNVAPYQPSMPCVRGGGWTHISGFSERVVDWIQEEEATA